MPSVPARAAHWLAWASGLSTRRAIRRGVMRVLMFHGVGDLSFPAETFDAVVRYLARHFEIIPLEEVLHRLPSRMRVSGREIALTFDDGLRNNVTVAWPTLRDVGAPATFFVCPTLIDRRRWLWNHEARVRLERLDEVGRAEVRAKLALPGLQETVHDPDAVVEAMKRLPSKARLDAEDAIRRATPGFVPSAEMRRRYDVMGWDDLGTVDPALVTIGSHTLSHPILPTLDDEALREEVQGSRARLEAVLGRKVELFCYPNGAEDERVRACVADTYRAAVTTEPGFVRAGDDPLRLRRVGAEPPRATLAWRLNRP